MSRVDALWARMLALFGHTWASQYGTVPVGIAADTWASALAGITPEQLAEGLRACVAEGREFPPSAGRFRAMCLGIPSVAAVRYELATPDAPRSPFVALVWRFIDSFAFRQADQRSADRMLADAYDVARERVMRGEALPAPAEAIAQQARAKPRPADPAKAAAAVAECRDLLGKAAPEVEPPTRHEPITTPAERIALEADLHAHYASATVDDAVDGAGDSRETPQEDAQ